MKGQQFNWDFFWLDCCFWNCCGRTADREGKNGKEKAAIQTSGVVSDAVEPKKIALTFDDGPHPVYTKILLDGLAERGAKASFLLQGRMQKNIRS